ncbi:hypothetical protein DQ04_00361040 [Trypanosoma grayi]|uniref:hypothetical protein n=1 Tax=Trypanosoma grayi TaxID=71804 RepID=UPI0004F40A9C|nr:hypothetical protein DQ04_00361040 [Trypanosoma grayi]KEG14642.1 hypothetical protein DQ04_00361040 [Trypanosoma grayi]
MSAGGRRHVQDCGSGNPVAPAPPEESHTRRQVPKHAAPHLDNDAQATRAEEVPPRPSRQRCRPPPFEKRAASEPRPRMTATPLRQSHLSLGSLTPAEETPRERPVPPPMVKKPLRSGRRHTPAPRSASVDDRHIGIKMVLPPHHWNSVTERREALMSYGIDAYEPRDVLHRNQSNWSIGYGSSTPKTKTLVNSTEGNGNGSEEKLKLVTSPNKLIQRSRRNSSTPRRREYDIISWMPL